MIWILFLSYFSVAGVLEDNALQEVKVLQQELIELDKVQESQNNKFQREKKALESEIFLVEKQIAQAHVHKQKQELALNDLQQMAKVQTQASEKYQKAVVALEKSVKEQSQLIELKPLESSSYADINAQGSEGLNIQMSSLLEKAVNAHKLSTETSLMSSSWRGSSGVLQNGEILRLGAVAAYSVNPHSNSEVLVPQKGGFVEAKESLGANLLSQREELKLVPVYIFSSMIEKEAWGKSRTWKEQVLGLTPALFLIFTFLIVGALFVGLIRE